MTRVTAIPTHRNQQVSTDVCIAVPVFGIRKMLLVGTIAASNVAAAEGPETGWNLNSNNLPVKLN